MWVGTNYGRIRQRHGLRQQLYYFSESLEGGIIRRSKGSAPINNDSLLMHDARVESGDGVCGSLVS